MCYMVLAYAALAAASAYQASSSRKATAQYQSEVAANNAKVADIQAADAKERGDTAAAQVRRKYAALIGTQRASLAARGLDISDGSANATIQDSVYFDGVDQQTTKANAAREAWGYQVRAQSMRGDAAAYKAGADAENPLLSAGMAGGTVAARWYQGGGGGGGGGGQSGYYGGMDDFYGGHGRSGD